MRCTKKAPVRNQTVGVRIERSSSRFARGCSLVSSFSAGRFTPLVVVGNHSIAACQGCLLLFGVIVVANSVR